MTFNASLHPRIAKGSAGGGRFAKGSAPAPSKQPSKKTGARYSKKQFAQLQSLEKQSQSGKKLSPRQAHALHVAHELHMQHQRATAKPKAAPRKPAAGKTAMRKTAMRKTAAPKVSAANTLALRNAGYR